MRLLNLTVENYGLFRGAHSFDLTQARAGNAQRNVVVFSGHNGAGKSTLFTALSVALHGPRALGERIPQQQYNEFVYQRLHRCSSGDKTIVSGTGRVQITFEFVRSGKPHQVQVERCWERRGRSFDEHLSLYQDGSPPDVPADDYQEWLNNLISPGLAHLCFFDAEQLDSLASPEQNSRAFNEALRRLLGLDLVERLQDDLDLYSQRLGGGSKIERLRQTVRVLQEELDYHKEQLDQRIQEAETLEQQIRTLQADLLEQERRLIAEGGRYAERRPELQSRLETVAREIETVTAQVRDLCANLLPFALAPALCRTLSKRLVHETEIHRRHIADGLWQESVRSVRSRIVDESFWHGIYVGEPERQELASRFMAVLCADRSPSGTAGEPIVHELAEPDRERLQTWISSVLDAVPEQSRTLGSQLRALQEEKRRIESELQRVPSEEALAPIHAQILNIHKELALLLKEQGVLGQRTGAIRYQYEAKEREVTRVGEELRSSQKTEERLSLADRSRQALRAYYDALIRQRLELLESNLVHSFNAICQKEHLLRTVTISPEDFMAQLRGADEHSMSLGDFSAGERQIYAMALLWALRQVSGQSLPLAIDTPLARLDDAHRLRFLHDYLPAVSGQVLLFATTAEIDADLLAQAEPHIARVYRLQYDDSTGATSVRCEEPARNQSMINDDGVRKGA